MTKHYQRPQWYGVQDHLKMPGWSKGNALVGAQGVEPLEFWGNFEIVGLDDAFKSLHMILDRH